MFARGCVAVVLCLSNVGAVNFVLSCRERSNHFRQDGGLCFEIPPWQHEPVEVELHVDRLRETWGNSSATRRAIQGSKLALVNADVTRYLDTVIAPFLDTYHRNIQSLYQQFTTKIMRRVKDEINAAVKRKMQVYTELTELADRLKVPAMCDEERRATRTVASRHVAQIYRCTEDTRASMAKMAKYAEEMISITRNYMQKALTNATSSLRTSSFTGIEGQKENVTACLKELSRAAVALGYELDLSLTNARRHNEQSCEKLTKCIIRAKKNTDESISQLQDYLYQCVYA